MFGGQMSWRDYFKREQLDSAALQALAQKRFPNRRGEIAARVMMVFHAKFRVGSRHLLPSARLVDELGFDDMDFIQMIRSVEKEFTIKIRAEDLERGATLDDLIACVENASVQPSAGGNAASPRASA
jgi:acyl carrier protein